MTHQNSLTLGLLAGLTSALIGAAWQVTTRYGVTTSLSPADLALLRYAIPAVALSPLLFKYGLVPKNTHRGWFALMVCAGGFVFGMLAMTGARFSPASHMGVLLSGTMPLFTALLFYFVTRESIGKRRLLGYALILSGALGLGFASARISLNDAWIGDIFFLSASLSWAFYTIAFRKLQLTPWYSTALVCFWSALAAIAWVIIRGDTALLRVPIAEFAFHALLQGVVAGLLGSFVFAFSVRSIGANNAAIFGALVPILSALGGYLFLSESVSIYAATGIAIVASGIALASFRTKKS